MTAFNLLKKNDFRLIAFAGILTTFALSGCGETQISYENRELVLKLATATSNRDPVAIGRAESEIQDQIKTGSLTEDESEAFRSIIELAGRSEWDAARIRAYALRDGQEPSAEDLERVARRTLPDIIKINGKRAK